MTYDASSRKDVRRAEKLAKQADRQRAEVVTGIMSVTNGRGWMYEFLANCHIYANPFTADPLRTAFACGEMNVGQKLLADIMLYCPDSYIIMIREHNERSYAAERSRSQDNDGGVEGSDNSGDDDRDEAA